MATTPNYGWVTPAPTDLVTDLPADFEIFADAVDADLAGLLGGSTGQVLKKTSGTDHDFAFGVDPTFDLVTTAGDLVYGTAADTMARLGIGTAGQVLKVNSGATAPEWGTAGAAGAAFSLLNAGGTTLSGASTTVSSISGQEQLIVLIINANCTLANAVLGVRFNSDSGTNYSYVMNNMGWLTTYNAAQFEGENKMASTEILVGRAENNANKNINATVTLIGGTGTTGKSFTATGTGVGGGNNAHRTNINQGIYLGSATISSVTVFPNSGTFNSGTIYVYGSAS